MLPDILIVVSPLIPSPRLIKAAASTAARLLGASRPNSDDDGDKALVDTSTAPRSPRAARAGKYDQALTSLVARRPGLTVAQAADELDVPPTALYPVIRRLEAREQLTKRGRELQPTPTADRQSPKGRDMERLRCDRGHFWERPRSRGPKPKRCPEHR